MEDWVRPVGEAHGEGLGSRQSSVVYRDQGRMGLRDLHPARTMDPGIGPYQRAMSDARSAMGRNIVGRFQESRDVLLSPPDSTVLDRLSTGGRERYCVPEVLARFSSSSFTLTHLNSIRMNVSRFSISRLPPRPRCLHHGG
jgi:hypothetical protein